MSEKRFQRTRRENDSGATPDPRDARIATLAVVESPAPADEREDQPVARSTLERPDGLLPGASREARRPLSSRRRDSIYRRALAVADIVAAAAALALAVIILGGDRVTVPLVAVIPLVVLVGKVVGLYDRDEHLLLKTTLDEAPALFQVATLYTLAIWLGEGVLVEETTVGAPDELGHSQVLGLWGLLFFGMLSARSLAREVVRRATPRERCLVLGSADAASRLEHKLETTRAGDSTVVGRVPLEARPDEADGPPVLGDLGELPRVLAQHHIERVIIAPTRTDQDQLLGAIRLVKTLEVKVSVLPRLFEVVGSSVRFDDVEGLILLGVPPYGLTKSSRYLKRGVDLVGAALGLLVLAPLFIVAALAIKLTSRGPVFFRQRRIGLQGREFSMLKFRTMFDGADERKHELLELNEAEGLFKIADDPRLTRVGRILRRLSLDELPQLFNVLHGEMSLVGPRPLVTDDDARITGLDRRRLDLTPGMTGIWQVLGSSSRVPLNEMVKIDYLYGANWSLWLDVKILLRTAPHVLGRRGV